MQITKCEKGHFFDGDKYEKCPHCGMKAEMPPTYSEENDSEPPIPMIYVGPGIPFPPTPKLDTLKVLQGDDWLSHFVYDDEGCGYVIPTDATREYKYFVSKSKDLKRKRTLINILKAVKDFSQTKDVYDKYIGKRKSTVFYSIHSREINLHERAMNTLHIESRYLLDADFDLFCEEIDKEIERIKSHEYSFGYKPRIYSAWYRCDNCHMRFEKHFTGDFSNQEQKENVICPNCRKPLS